MRRDKGNVGLGLVLFVVVVIFAFGVCLAATCDDDNSDSAPVLVEKKHDKKHDDRDQDRSNGKNSRGKCEGADYCDDRDFSPTFDKSPVQDSFNICLPGATCHYDGNGEPAPADSDQAVALPPVVVCAPYHCDPQPEGDRHV